MDHISRRSPASGLHGVPPLLLGALRFMLAAFPAVLFVKRPKLPLRWHLAYGGTISFGQCVPLHRDVRGHAAGLTLIGLQSSSGAGVGAQAMTAAGFVLTLCAACMWALSNIVTIKVGKVDLVGLVVWASLISALPLFLALSYMNSPTASKRLAMP